MGKYLDKIRRHEQGEHTQPIKTIQAAASPTILAGTTIAWQRADLTIQTGLVDDIHVDDTGTPWAFVTIGESWTAVNLTFATVTTDADLTRGSTAKADACFACQGTRRWVSIHGVVVCGECHPPACASLVKEWIG